MFLPAEENHTRLGECGCKRKHTRCTRIRKLHKFIYSEFTLKIQKSIFVINNVHFVWNKQRTDQGHHLGNAQQKG